MEKLIKLAIRYQNAQHMSLIFVGESFWDIDRDIYYWDPNSYGEPYVQTEAGFVTDAKRFMSLRDAVEFAKLSNQMDVIERYKPRIEEFAIEMRLNGAYHREIYKH